MRAYNDKIEMCKEVSDITERKLPLILRQGITFIFIMVTGLLIVSCFTKYSEKVPLDIILTNKNRKIVGEAVVPLNTYNRITKNMPVILSLPDYYGHTLNIDTCLVSNIHCQNDSCTLTIIYPKDLNKTTKNMLPFLRRCKTKGYIIISEKYLITYFIDQLNFKR